MIEKKFYKIKDVSEFLGVPQSTIRFWEKEFPSCRPSRSRSNIRYYKPEDIDQLRIVHYLVKVRGLKIEAAKEQIRVNRHNISRRIEVIDRLTDVRNRLDTLLKTLSKRENAAGGSSDGHSLVDFAD
ncbi:MAG: MerR family transcriptional regulator [Bacteroidales bacterium]|nr:MerR family transcriptional regulator [Bacteroidales bacterium]MBD5221389.1 MerR family transcriptional regulator [Bacteroidales bacterium]